MSNSSKSSTLENQNPNFEMYSDDSSNAGKSLSYIDVDVDNVCEAAKRSSRTDSDDALEMGEDRASSFASSGSLSQVNSVENHQQVEECVDIIKEQVTDTQSNSEKLQTEFKSSLGDLASAAYLGLVFRNNNVTGPSTDQKDYICLPFQGESSTDPDSCTSLASNVIATESIKNKTSEIIENKTKGAIISMDCDNQNECSDRSGIVLQNSVVVDSDESLLENNISQMCCDIPLSCSTPVTSNHLSTSKPKILGSMYSVNNLGSPIRITSDLKNSSSSQCKSACVSADNADPWIPRKQTKSPGCKYIFRQYSMNAGGTQNKVKLRKRVSNSCNSLDGEQSLSNNKKKLSSHKRISSDTSTLVFSNKTAFISLDCPHVLVKSPEVQNSLMRYATPPRELGPDHLIEEINQYKDNGKIVIRYATPPREVMDTACLDGTIYKNNYTCALENEIAKLNAQDDEHLRETDDPRSQKYIAHFPESSGADNISDFGASSRESGSVRPGSFHSSMSSSVLSNQSKRLSTTPSKSPVACSSASLFSNDGIVYSVRNAVITLRSKFTGRSPRSVDASPVRMSPRRARSLGAEEDIRVSNVPCNDDVKNQRKCQKGNVRDKIKHNSVFQFARTYSEKLNKNKTRPCSSQNKSINVENLEVSVKQDTGAVGERTVDTKSKLIGTYKLGKYNAVNCKTGCKSQKCNIIADNEVMDTEEKRIKDKTDIVKDVELQLDEVSINLDTSESDINEDVLSLDCFYEKQCNDILESQIGSECYRDSAVYSDDGGMSSLDLVAPCDTVIETKEASENTYKKMKAEEKRQEKGKKIQNILKSLEAGTKSKSSAESPRLSVMKSSATSITADDLFKVKMSPTLTRNKNRELMEVAMLTRIRQNPGESNSGMVCVGQCKNNDNDCNMSKP